MAVSFPGGDSYNRQNERGGTFIFPEIEGIFQIIQVKTPIAIVHLDGVPYSLEVNDSKFWRGELITPEHFFEVARSCFDMLYEEGATHPKMMSMGLHCRIIGKPGRANGLKQFLQYASEKEGVWFARRLDIARWWLGKFPA